MINAMPLNKSMPTAPSNQIPWRVLIILFGLIALSALLSTQRVAKSVDLTSVNIAATLIKTDIYTTGQKTEPGTPPAAGYDHPPGYPAIISAVAMLDPNSGQYLDCLGQRRTDCPNAITANAVIGLQIIAVCVSLFLVFLITMELTNDREIATFTLILFALCSRMVGFSTILWPHVFVTTLQLAACYYILLSCTRQKIHFAALAGICFGLAALFRPALALAPFIIAPIILIRDRHHPGRSITKAVLLIGTTALVLAPWLMRNYIQFEDFAITQYYSADLLAKRVAYNNLNFVEWTAAFITWIPEFGDGFASLIYAPETIDRLSNSLPQGIINEDGKRILTEGLRGENIAGPFWFIFDAYVIKQPIAYLLAIPPVFMHGFWGSGSILGLAGFIALFPLIRRLNSTGKTEPFTLVLWSFFASLIAQSLCSPNLHFLNDQMLFIHAYAIAHVTGGLELPRILRRAIN